MYYYLFIKKFLLYYIFLFLIKTCSQRAIRNIKNNLKIFIIIIYLFIFDFYKTIILVCNYNEAAIKITRNKDFIIPNVSKNMKSLTCLNIILKL